MVGAPGNHEIEQEADTTIFKALQARWAGVLISPEAKAALLLCSSFRFADCNVLPHICIDAVVNYLGVTVQLAFQSSDSLTAKCAA